MATDPESEKPRDEEVAPGQGGEEPPRASDPAVRRYNATTDVDSADYDAALEGTDPLTRAIDRLIETRLRKRPSTGDMPPTG